MSFWLRSMRQTISVKVYTGRDTYGDASFSAATSYPARVEQYSDTIALEDGKEVTVSHRLATTAQLKIADVVVLPGETVERTVRGVKRGPRLTADQYLTEALVG